MFSRLYIFIIFVLVFIQGVNALAVAGVIDYQNLWWLDVILHSLGGVLVASFSFWFYFDHKKYRADLLPSWLLVLGFVSFTVFVGVLWEFYEFLWDVFLSHPYGIDVAQPDMKDVMSYLFFDMFGAAAASLALFLGFRRKIRA